MDQWLCTLPILTSPTKSLNIMSHSMVAFCLPLSSFTSHCSVTGAIAWAILPTPACLRFTVDSVEEHDTRQCHNMRKYAPPDQIPPLKCVRCQGPHAATDHSCPVQRAVVCSHWQETEQFKES